MDKALNQVLGSLPDDTKVYVSDHRMDEPQLRVHR